MTEKAKDNEFKYEMTGWRGFVQAKMESTTEKLTRIENRLDNILEKDLVTRETLRDVIQNHAGACPARANPGEHGFVERGLGAWVSAYSKIGLIGILIGTNVLLIITILKLAKVF